MNIFKIFVRPQLDYGDVIYDEAYNETFLKKLESIQYNACLALSEVIRASSREKIYQELGLEPYFILFYLGTRLSLFPY